MSGPGDFLRRHPASASGAISAGPLRTRVDGGLPYAPLRMHPSVTEMWVEVVPFDRVTHAHAAAEGEGDGSLEEWRRTHWEYYQRELAGTEFEPRDDMPIVCEYFTVVYPPGAPLEPQART